MYIATGIRTGSLFFLVLEHPVALSYCYPAREPKHAHMALANSDAIAIIMSELCGPLVLWQLVLVTIVTFLTVWTLVVEAIPTLMRCQYTSNRSVEFMHRLGCYDSCNEIYLTTILKHFACVRIWCMNVSHIKCVEAQTGIIHLFWIYHCHSNRNILQFYWVIVMAEAYVQSDWLSH